MSTVYLVTVGYYDVSGAAAGTLYYSNGTFNSSPTDTPANTHFAPRLKERPRLRRSTFSPGRTGGRATSAVGEVVLINNDGGLDALNGYAFDARAINVYRGEDTAAFPAGFTLMLKATASGPAVITRTEVRIPLRDRQTELDVPLQTTLYAGNNSLPNGLEGVASDLKDKPKPLCYGAVRNVEPPMVNTSKLIYQVNDGAVSDMDIYDNGEEIPSDPTLDWEQHPVPWRFDSEIWGLAWSPTLNIYVGTGFERTNSRNAFLWSDDAETWHIGTMTGATHPYFKMQRVRWCNNQFVAVGLNYDGGSNVCMIATSTDGKVWVFVDVSSIFTGSIPVQDVAYSEALDVLVAVGAAGKLASSADDGMTWTARTTGFGSSAITGIAWSDDEAVFVAVGESGKIETSAAVATWTTRTSGVSGMLEEVCRSESLGLFLAVGKSSARITSTNGVTWVDRSASGDWLTCTWVDAFKLFLITKSGDPYTSPDGINFTKADSGIPASPGGEVWYASCASDRSVVVGGEGTVTGNQEPPLYKSLAPIGVLYASEAELLDDANAPPPGAAGFYLAGGYFRLGSSPSGTVTADVTQGASAGDRTGAQLSTDVLLEAGMTSADWSASDVAALDSANSSVLGLWTGTTETMASRALSFFADTLGAWWAFDKAGIWRTARLDTPLGATSVISFTENDVWGLERVKGGDARSGLPSYRQILRYSRNYTVQNDPAGSVSDVRRALIAEEWQTVKAETASVKTAYLLAREVTTETAFSVAANASTEATRRQALRGTKRDVFEFTTRIDSNTLTLDLGQIINVTHSRFGLSAGKNLAVIGLDADAKTDSVRVQAWG